MKGPNEVIGEISLVHVSARKTHVTKALGAEKVSATVYP
jgi:hypothetical protein